MSKAMIPYVQFYTGDAERFIAEPNPYPVPTGYGLRVKDILDAGLKFGVKAYTDGKAVRIFTYRNHDSNDVVEVVDVFKGASNADIEYAHQRLIEKTLTNNYSFAHDGKSA